jgi:hypothetical protein
VAKKQLEAAVSFVSSLWYTAWVRAGKPGVGRQPEAVRQTALAATRLSDKAQFISCSGWIAGRRVSLSPGPNRESGVTRKQISAVVVIVLMACTLTALVAYRSGRRQPVAPKVPAAASFARETGSCVAFTDAVSLLEKSGCVTGLVLRVYTSRGRNTFLDFCPDYRSCPFTSVIFASDRSKFGDLNALTGRQVEIHGLVESYEGRAEIIIRDPQQISVLP